MKAPRAPLKSLSPITEDILAQNYHLKQQLIKVKKTLTNFQDTMVAQLSKFASTSGSPGLIFDDANECLSCFLGVFEECRIESRKNKQEVDELRNKIRVLQNGIQSDKQLASKLGAKQQQFEETKAKYEAIVKDLRQEVRKIQQDKQYEQYKLSQELSQLRKQCANMEVVYDNKLSQVKKSLQQNYNKDIAKYRKEVDQDLHVREKQIKHEIDQKDDEVRLLLASITHLTGEQQALLKAKNKGKKQSTHRCTDHKDCNQGISDDMTKCISVLKQVVQPFSEHTALLQKLSNERRQNLQLKNELRCQQTTNLDLMNQLQQKTHQISSLSLKLSVSQAEYNKLLDQYCVKCEQLHKCIDDKKALDKYYDDRWNSEMASVKYHLERKYVDRQATLESEYGELIAEVEEQRTTLKAENQAIKEEREHTRRQNQEILQQIQQIRQQKQAVVSRNRRLETLVVEKQEVVRQEVEKVHASYVQLKVACEAQVSNGKQQMEALNRRIAELQAKHLEQVKKITEKYQSQVQNTKYKAEQQYETIILEKQTTIERLMTSVEEHKKVINDLLKEQSGFVEEARQSVLREKEREIREMKVKNYEQINVLKEKIAKSEEKIKEARITGLQKQEKVESEKNEKVKIIKEREDHIAALKNDIEKLKSAIKQLQAQLAQSRAQIDKLKFGMQSLVVENNGHKVSLRQKEREISNLINEKKSWICQIQTCKKQYQKGFKQLSEINDKKVSHLRSRIWELEQLCENGGISKKDFERIKNLIDEKKQLETMVALKQAQILVLNQVKDYYENKSRQSDSKLMINYELKKEQPIFIRRPKRNILDEFRRIKTLVKEDLKDFDEKQSYQIKNVPGRPEDVLMSDRKLPKGENVENKFRKTTSRHKNHQHSSFL